MNANATIIDVEPVEHSSSRNTSASKGARDASTSHSGGYANAQGAHYTRPTWGSASSQQGGQVGFGSPFSQHGSAGQRGQTFYGGSFTQFGNDMAAKSPAAVTSGLAQMAIGTGLVLLGIPMLILPGPGLLSIAGGMLLASRGARKVFG